MLFYLLTWKWNEEYDNGDQLFWNSNQGRRSREGHGDVLPPPPQQNKHLKSRKFIKFTLLLGQVCSHRSFQEPVWINTDLNSKRHDSLCMTWCFIRTQNKARWTSRSAKHSLHAVCVHSYSTPEDALSQKRTFLTWTKAPAIAVWKQLFTGNQKHEDIKHAGLRQYMVYLCFYKSSPGNQ